MSKHRTVRVGAAFALTLCTIASCAALALAGTSVSASAAASTTHTSWFHDPVSAAARRAEIAVPADPDAYVGPIRHTTATFRTESGAFAVPITRAAGHTVVRGEALSLSRHGLFAFNSPRLTRTAHAEIAALGASFRGVTAVRCEGYTDFGGTKSHEHELSLARARAACTIVRRHHRGISTTSVGYGGTRPVIVGGTHADRAQNRRVIIAVTASRPLVTRPGSPHLSRAVAGNATAALTFTAPKHDGGAQITGYQVSTNHGQAWKALTPRGHSPFTVTLNGLSNGTAYPLTVRATNSAGHGAASNTLTVTPVTVPGPPTITDETVGVVQKAYSITLTFASPTSDGGSPVSGYLYSQNSGPYTALVYTAGTPNVSTISAGPFHCGARASFTYTLEAVNEQGIGAPSAPYTAALPDIAVGAATGRHRDC
jgi:outer membrane protein OmpA-like peptidoglycan-associated protein